MATTHYFITCDPPTVAPVDDQVFHFTPDQDSEEFADLELDCTDPLYIKRWSDIDNDFIHVGLGFLQAGVPTYVAYSEARQEYILGANALNIGGHYWTLLSTNVSLAGGDAHLLFNNLGARADINFVTPLRPKQVVEIHNGDAAQFVRLLSLTNTQGLQFFFSGELVDDDIDIAPGESLRLTALDENRYAIVDGLYVLNTIPAPPGPQGPQGVPGINWIASGWSGGVHYNINDALYHNGSSYIALQTHTASSPTEPGVGGGWTTHWQFMAAGGAQGPQGVPGLYGAIGAQGPQGNTGTIGPQGPQGFQGVAGTAGADNTAYGVAWLGSMLPPTQNATYIKIRSLARWLEIAADHTLALGDHHMAATLVADRTWTLPLGTNVGGMPEEIWALNAQTDPFNILIAPPSGKQIIHNGVELAADEAAVVGPGDMAISVPLGTDYNYTWAVRTFAANASGRELLTASRTYYVRADGDDSNDGLSNDAAGAFETIQTAIWLAADTLDFGGYTVTIQVADGTHAGFWISGEYLNGRLEIIGNVTTPANCIISEAGTAILATYPNTVLISGFKVTTTGSGGSGVLDGHGVAAEMGANIELGHVAFGTTAGSNIYADGASIDVSGTFAVTGNADAFLKSTNNGVIKRSNIITTLTGTPAYSEAFVVAADGGVILEKTGGSYSGSATGKRYAVSGSGVIDALGASETFYPGDALGTIANGGEYLGEAKKDTDRGYLGQNLQTGTTYTLVITDAGKIIDMSNASAIALTIPANASVPFPIDTRIDINQYGAGQVTVGITTDTLRGATKTPGQYKAVSLWKRTATEWVIWGGTT